MAQLFSLGDITHMPDTLISRIEKLTDQQLDAELASHEHNDIGRHIILAEKSRRNVLRASKPRWIDWAILIVGLLAATFAFLQWHDSRPPAVDPIQGRWLDTQSHDFTEFHSDGTFLMSYRGLEKPEVLTGRWSKTSDDSFKLEMEMLGTRRVLVTLSALPFMLTKNPQGLEGSIKPHNRR